MKKFFCLLLSVLSLSAAAQNPMILGNANSWVYITGVGEFSNVWNAKLLDTTASKLIYPLKTVNRWARENGRLYFNPTGTKFILVDDVPAIDTSSLSSRIDQRVKYTDTAAMLINYALKSKVLTDSTALSSAINSRVKYTDTAALLLPYLRNDDIGISVQPYDANTTLLGNNTSGTGNVILRQGSPVITLPSIAAVNVSGGILSFPTGSSGTLMRWADTASLSNRINLKLNITDTANLKPRLTAGTNVTITGTYPALTISASGGGAPLDTASLSTRIDARVKYTDTASMLGNYLRKADTSTLSNRINLKVSIADTAAMLTNYLRKTDTSTLSTRINLKLSSSDTTAMLTPYARKTLVADTAAAIRVGINSFANFLYRSQNGLTFKGKSIVLISDSYGIGTGATSAAFGFSQVFAKYVGCTILNYSSNGATLMRQVPINYALGTNVMSIVSTIPNAGIYDTNIVMICIGLNDIGQNGANYTPTNFYLTYDSLITQLVAKGYLVQNIVIVSPWRVQQAGLNFYGVLSGNAPPTFAHMDSFVTKTSDIALARGCPYVDVYTMQKYSDTNTFADANHRNNRGNYNIAEHIWESLSATMATIDQQTEYAATDLTFTGANITNAGTTWTATGIPGSYGNLGLSASSVPANANCRLQQDYNGDRGVLGFNTDNAATGYAGIEAGFLVASGSLYAVDNGGVSSPLITVNSSEKYSLLRSGSNFFLQKSVDGGVSWTNVAYTFSASYSTALYVVCDINTSLINPKLSLFSPFSTGDALGRIYVSNGSSGILPVANDFRYDTTSKTVITPTVNATKYTLSTLNTAPSSSSDTGTKGEIRFTAGYIYVCTATNTWVRVALSSF